MSRVTDFTRAARRDPAVVAGRRDLRSLLGSSLSLALRARLLRFKKCSRISCRRRGRASERFGVGGRVRGCGLRPLTRRSCTLVSFGEGLGRWMRGVEERPAGIRDRRRTWHAPQARLVVTSLSSKTDFDSNGGCRKRVNERQNRGRLRGTSPGCQGESDRLNRGAGLWPLDEGGQTLAVVSIRLPQAIQGRFYHLY